jgi:hypothetical protein
MTAPLFTGLKPIRTHKQVGVLMKCSDVHAAQLEKRALRKLHRLLIERGLTFEDLLPEQPKNVPVRWEDDE